MDIGIIGVPIDLGADRRGVDMGASAIRYTGLDEQLRGNGHTVRDFGNVTVPPAESVDGSGHGLKYLHSIVTMSEQLAAGVDGIMEQGYLPLVLGGDHSLSLGSITGATRNRKLGLVWIDAHGDFNTEATSPSGNIHGMVLAALAGHGDSRLVEIDGRSPKVDPHNIVLLGTRSVDPAERALLKKCGVTIYSMYEIDRMGLPAILEKLLDRFSESNIDGIHVSLDLDVVDPSQAPGVGTPVFGGLTYRETHLAMEMLAETCRITSMDVVEVNPVLDNHNETARLAMEFVLSGMGKRIV